MGPDGELPEAAMEIETLLDATLEGSEAAVEAAGEAVVEGAVKAAEDRHASEVETACEPESEPGPVARLEMTYRECERRRQGRKCAVSEKSCVQLQSR